MTTKNKKYIAHGFTLIEVIVLVAIVGIFLLVVTQNLFHHRERALDSRIKSDLNRLRIAFEDYYNDHNCYPPPTWFDSPDDCQTNNLQPYMNTMPCDPRTHQPYHLVVNDNTCPTQFQLYANLSNPYDPEAEALWVNDGSGEDGYNYGISSPNSTAKIDPPPNANNNNTNLYYCSGLNNCTMINGSPPPGCNTYINSNCNNACSNPSNVCNQP